jgi:hypothetical protein
MISKIASFTDPALDRQINEIIFNQFGNLKEITVTFTAANTTTVADVGFRADRYFPVSKTADVRVWHSEAPDDRYMYLQASGTATVILKVWKTDANV